MDGTQTARDGVEEQDWVEAGRLHRWRESFFSLQHLTEDQRQAEYRRMVGEIQATAEAENEEKGRKPVVVAAILAQDPHSKPASTDRSPAPFVHATDDSTDLKSPRPAQRGEVVERSEAGEGLPISQVKGQARPAAVPRWSSESATAPSWMPFAPGTSPPRPRLRDQGRVSTPGISAAAAIPPNGLNRAGNTGLLPRWLGFTRADGGQ